MEARVLIKECVALLVISMHITHCYLSCFSGSSEPIYISQAELYQVNFLAMFNFVDDLCYKVAKFDLISWDSFVSSSIGQYPDLKYVGSKLSDQGQN